jgi:hypothetical protein
MTFLLSLSACWPVSAVKPNALSPQSVGLTLHAQSQSLCWSIAGNANGKNPNVLSELTWKRLDGVEADLNIQWMVGHRWLVVLPASLGLVLSGRVTDCDYEGEDRASRVACSEVSGSGGYTIQTYPHFGYLFRAGEHIQLMPEVGYQFCKQLFPLKDGATRLNSSYRPRWYGPGFSLEARTSKTGKIGSSLSVNYFQMDYRADANWNLIETVEHPVSFSHKAKGYGIEPVVQVHYDLSSSLQFLLKCSYSHWSTGKGEDTLYRIDETLSLTQLNDVTWNVFSAGCGFSFFF